MKITVEIPRCWKRLASTLFQYGGDYLVVDGTQHKVYGRSILEDQSSYLDDPEPHYDDGREVAVKADGVTVCLGVYSGQGNYYPICIIEDSEGNIIYEETWDDIDDVNQITDDNDNEHIIQIEWVGEDPYEHGYPELTSPK